jgi:O-succinylbenzoate synthase
MIIKCWTSKYELIPWGPIGAVAEGKPREGALLKVQWPNGLVGYADIFPWPEHGDAPIDDQIIALARGKVSTLVEQSMWLAKKDAQMRKLLKNAFAGAAKVKNHYLISDYTKFTDANMTDLRSSGFTTVKVKVGRNVDEEAKFIVRILRQNPITVRLDFNAKVDFSQFERFMSHLGSAERAKIEFVEDPLPWDLESWTEAAKFAPLAMDMEYEKLDWEKLTGRPPFTVLVLKPARQDVEKALRWINRYALKIVVSSSMDHPVGVAHACAQAAELKKFYPNTLLDCGCLTLKSYRPNDFNNRFQTTGPFVKEIPGTGIGFNELLEGQLWVPVEK